MKHLPLIALFTALIVATATAQSPTTNTVVDSSRGIEFIGADNITLMIAPHDSAIATNQLTSGKTVLRTPERQAVIDRLTYLIAQREKYRTMWTQLKSVVNANGFSIQTRQDFVDNYPDILDWVLTTGALTAAQKQTALARLPALYLAIKDDMVPDQ